MLYVPQWRYDAVDPQTILDERSAERRVDIPDAVDAVAARQSLRDFWSSIQIVRLPAFAGVARDEEAAEGVRPFLRDEVRVDRGALELGVVRVGLERDLLRQRVVQVVAVLQAAGAAAVDDRHAVDHHRLSLARLPCTTRFIPVSGIEPPTFWRTPVTSTAGVSAAKLTKLRSVGRTSITSREAVAFANDVLCIDDRALAGDRHGLLQRADPQVGVDVGGEGGRQLDAFAARGVEALRA